MEVLKLLIHGLGLAGINFAAVLLGFAVYFLLRPAPQLAVQLPVAIAASILGFALWVYISKVLFAARAMLEGWKDYLGVYLAAWLWSPLIFVPLHYLGTGYVTAFSNVIALWAFQAPVNLVALGIIYLCYNHGNRVSWLPAGPGAG
ncbi:MAG: hypothetical protein JW892_02535 [Anaerolineae bacterium]|nr:hypothetical protein [Anaerolineae bacterium]